MTLVVYVLYLQRSATITTNTHTMNTNGKSLQDQYLEYMYLGNYYRWSAQHRPHIGSRSPIDGRQLTGYTATPADIRAHYTSCLAMSRAYFVEAKQLRKILLKAGCNVHGIDAAVKLS